MDLTDSDNLNNTQTHCPKCYKSPDLIEPILDSSQTASFSHRYILGAQLGLGKFGIIRECVDKSTGEILACKSIAKERLVTEDDVRSVKLEIEILTKLSGHENVVDLKAVYEDEDHVHLLMELCAGGELFHLIEKRGNLSEHEASVVFKQLMEVVMYCHDKGIMHRDLKPENILLVSRSSSSSPIKLADFGLATHIEYGQTLHGTVGSPFYIAPEVLAGGYNQGADVWSAGVILYILLSGIPPFWGKTKSTIFDAVRAANLCFHSDPWDQISASAKDLISGMLCVDPSKRLTAAEVLAHSWTTSPDTQEESYGKNYLSRQELEIGSCSFSNLNVFSDRDLSFGDGSPFTVKSEPEDSPVFSCRSSFSPALVNGGTHSDSCCKSNAHEFSSPITSMPSFTFFTPAPTLEQSNEPSRLKTKMMLFDGEPSIRKLNLSPDPAEPPITEQSWGGWASVSKATNLQSKRNHTIGLGEIGHLDLIDTASVSRWASCTQIPSAASLRSSLVC